MLEGEVRDLKCSNERLTLDLRNVQQQSQEIFEKQRELLNGIFQKALGDCSDHAKAQGQETAVTINSGTTGSGNGSDSFVHIVESAEGACCELATSEASKTNLIETQCSKQPFNTSVQDLLGEQAPASARKDEMPKPTKLKKKKEKTYYPARIIEHGSIE